MQKKLELLGGKDIVLVSGVVVGAVFSYINIVTLKETRKKDGVDEAAEKYEENSVHFIELGSKVLQGSMDYMGVKKEAESLKSFFKEKQVKNIEQRKNLEKEKKFLAENHTDELAAHVRNLEGLVNQAADMVSDIRAKLDNKLLERMEKYRELQNAVHELRHRFNTVVHGSKVLRRSRANDGLKERVENCQKKTHRLYTHCCEVAVLARDGDGDTVSPANGDYGLMSDVMESLEDVSLHKVSSLEETNALYCKKVNCGYMFLCFSVLFLLSYNVNHEELVEMALSFSSFF